MDSPKMKWIPVVIDTLPFENDDKTTIRVLMTYEHPVSGRCVTTGYFKKRYDFITKQNEITAFCDKYGIGKCNIHEIIAWMPMPDIYEDDLIKPFGSKESYEKYKEEQEKKIKQREHQMDLKHYSKWKIYMPFYSLIIILLSFGIYKLSSINIEDANLMISCIFLILFMIIIDIISTIKFVHKNKEELNEYISKKGENL